jgi:hypothetical protein
MVSFSEDFQLVNQWAPDTRGPRWYDASTSKYESKYIVDQKTGKRYFNEYPEVVGFKCFLLTLGTPIVHLIVAVASVIFSAVKLLCFYHLWKPVEGEAEYNFKARMIDIKQETLALGKFLLAPLLLEAAAIYGMFRPYDGRKLYASVERTVYGGFVLAPCFQPEATRHAFGGNVDQKNAF